jgi:hypothetical protein
VRRVESTARSSSSRVFVPSTVRRAFVNEVDRQLVSGAECDCQVVSCRKTSRTVVVAVLVTRWEPCRVVDVVGKTPSSPTSSYCGRRVKTPPTSSYCGRGRREDSVVADVVALRSWLGRVSRVQWRQQEFVGGQSGGSLKAVLVRRQLAPA